MTAPMTDSTDLERIAFENQNPYLDYTRTVGPWGAMLYKHSHIQVAWESWLARAALSTPASLPASEPSDELLDRLQEEYDCYGECDAPRIHDFGRAVWSAALASQPAAASTEADENAPWLTKAHMLCTDHGVPQGRIEWRLDVLRGLLEDSAASQPAAASTPTPASLPAMTDAECVAKGLPDSIDRAMAYEAAQPAAASTPVQDEIHLAWRGALKACGVSEADRDAISEVVISMVVARQQESAQPAAASTAGTGSDK